MSQTELTLSTAGLPPFSARGCVQTLTPINGGELRRTVDGRLVYTGRKDHNKYRSIITCKDKSAPALEGVWRGSLVTVGCIQRLTQEIEGDGVKKDFVLERPAVAGSVLAMDKDGSPLEIREENELILAPQPGDFVYVSYRPLLTMRVVNFVLDTDEWGLKVGWKLELEEA